MYAGPGRREILVDKSGNGRFGQGLVGLTPYIQRLEGTELRNIPDLKLVKTF